MAKKLTLKKAMERAQVNKAILSQDAEIGQRRLHHIIEGTVEATAAEKQFIADVLGVLVDDIDWPAASEERAQDDQGKGSDQEKGSDQATEPAQADQGSSRQNFLEGIMNRLEKGGGRDRP
jgi:hypothetical protein